MASISSIEGLLALKRLPVNPSLSLKQPVLTVVFLSLLVVIGAVLSSCDNQNPDIPPRQIKLYQNWRIQPGDTIGDYLILSSLGDISIQLQGKPIYAPFQGQVEPHNSRCVIFSSSELPAYLFRLCGLNQPRLGPVKSGEKIGSGDSLQFAALRKQPNDTWAFVEPAQSILEKFLVKPQ